MTELNKADVIYNELIKDVYNNGTWDKNSVVRTVYADGTPAYTKSVFGRQIVFEEGIIPLISTKRVGWKTAFKEMRLFWMKQTVKKEDFKKDNVKVWNEWFLEDGTLGKSYAYQFESRPNKEVVKVKEIKKDYPDSLSKVISNNERETPNYSTDSAFIGEIFSSANYGDFVVLDVYSPDKDKGYSVMCKIQFLDTNYITYVNIREIKTRREIRDRFVRSVYGIGYLGEKDSSKLFSNEEYQYLKNVWRNMLSRCYNEKDINYKNYGEKKIFVDERWHSLENFIKDISYTPQFFMAKADSFKNWNLDKDYYNSNCYSMDTCVWLYKNDNVLYAKMKKPFILTNGNNEKEICISIIDTANKYNLNKIYLANALNGKSTCDIGNYTASYFECEDDYIYRYRLSENQVVNLIRNIQNHPMSRRLMTSFWNDTDVQHKALQECAMQTTWNVRDSKIDLILYSRSLDLALGCPYNWIQYWLLLQIVAHVTGYRAGKFIHQIGNAHYYDRHESMLLKQIKNNQYMQPDFYIKEEAKDFFNFTVEDIIIENYKNNGDIYYEVAI